MKKIIASAFAATFIFGLTACGNPNVDACETAQTAANKVLKDCGKDAKEIDLKCEETYKDNSKDCADLFKYYTDVKCEGEGDAAAPKYSSEKAPACK